MGLTGCGGGAHGVVRRRGPYVLLVSQEGVA